MEEGRTITDQLALEVQEQGAPAYMKPWAKVRGVAYWIGKRYAGLDAEDKEQAAHEALLRAVRSFDPDKGPFLTAYKFALQGAYFTTRYGGHPACGLHSRRAGQLHRAGGAEADPRRSTQTGGGTPPALATPGYITGIENLSLTRREARK